MRFKEETWLPMIGDKYDIANFDGMILSGLNWKRLQLLKNSMSFADQSLYILKELRRLQV